MRRAWEHVFHVLELHRSRAPQRGCTLRARASSRQTLPRPSSRLGPPALWPTAKSATADTKAAVERSACESGRWAWVWGSSRPRPCGRAGQTAGLARCAVHGARTCGAPGLRGVEAAATGARGQPEGRVEDPEGHREPGPGVQRGLRPALSPALGAGGGEGLLQTLHFKCWNGDCNGLCLQLSVLRSSPSMPRVLHKRSPSGGRGHRG